MYLAVAEPRVHRAPVAYVCSYLCLCEWHPCRRKTARRDTPKLTDEQLDQYIPALPAWELNDNRTAMSRSFVAKNFVAAIDFFNQVKDVAEAEGHHPDLHLTNYRKVVVNMSTHAVGGLTMPDLVMAAKIDDIEVKYSPKWLQQQTSAE